MAKPALPTGMTPAAIRTWLQWVDATVTPIVVSDTEPDDYTLWVDTGGGS